MEHARIHRRLLERGVTLEIAHTLLGVESDVARIACIYSARERALPCETLVLVTARLPNEGLAEELLARRGEWDAAGIRSVRAVGDAFAPGTIASAVWDGRRYAEELDGEDFGDAVPFRREVVALAESPVHTVQR
jgi:dimethylamine/trimethylamine dehydrogenase